MPPVEAAYQLYVPPLGAPEAVNVTVPVPHTEPAVVVGAVVVDPSVTVAVLEQLPSVTVT